MGIADQAICLAADGPAHLNAIDPDGQIQFEAVSNAQQLKHHLKGGIKQGRMQAIARGIVSGERIERDMSPRLLAVGPQAPDAPEARTIVVAPFVQAPIEPINGYLFAFLTARKGWRLQNPC